MKPRINITEMAVSIIPSTDYTKLQESAKSGAALPDKIVTVVEAIHSGLTRNYTFYPADNLERSTESWTRDYAKPVLKNHDIHSEPLGRVLSATYKPSNIASDKQTIELELEIVDEDTIRKVLDGRYHTLSIGGNTSSAVCSICAKDLVKEGYCGHMKGRTYEGKQAHWIIGEMAFDEISWVNVPADSSAQVVHKNTTKQTESTSKTEGGVQEMDPEQQSQEILNQIDDLLKENAGAPPADPATPETPAAPEAGTQTEGATPPAVDPATPPADPAAPTLQEQLDAAVAKVALLETENLTLVADKEALVTQVGTLTTEKTQLTASKTQLEADLAVADNENKGLLQQSVTLAGYSHKILAEAVATVERALGKIEDSAFESTMTELTKLTSRSLKEKLTELGKEKPVRIVQTVENPLNAGGGEPIAQGTKPDENQEKVIDLKDYAEKFNAAFNRQLN